MPNTYRTHVLIKYIGRDNKPHQNYVPVGTQNGTKTKDWIDMWCIDRGIPSPVHLIEDSIGRAQHTLVR